MLNQALRERFGLFEKESGADIYSLDMVVTKLADQTVLKNPPQRLS